MLTKTGQVVVVVNIRIAPGTRARRSRWCSCRWASDPPRRKSFRVDDGKTVDLQIQTCERSSGCYANTRSRRIC